VGKAPAVENIALSETEINYANWMGDVNYLADVMLDSEIDLEPWMIDPRLMDSVFITEDAIELEPWMFDPHYLDAVL
jgi:hypothetical protein